MWRMRDAAFVLLAALLPVGPLYIGPRTALASILLFFLPLGILWSLYAHRDNECLLFRVGVPCVIHRIANLLGDPNTEPAASHWQWLEEDQDWIHNKYVPVVVRRLEKQVQAPETPWWNRFMVTWVLIPRVHGLFRDGLKELKKHAIHLHTLEEHVRNQRCALKSLRARPQLPLSHRTFHVSRDRTASAELHTWNWLPDWILDGLLEELITQRPPVITGAPARLQACGGCKGQPIRKGLLGAQDEVTVTTWGRAPCGEWWCSDCLALRVHDAAPAYDFADIVRGDLVLPVQIDCNGKMHMIKDFFFTTFVGVKRVPANRW